MKEKLFSIKDTKIYRRVKGESGFTAQTRSTAVQSSRLAALAIVTDDEKGFIDEYIQLAVNECATVIARYLSPCCINEEDDPDKPGYMIRHFTVSIPDNFPVESIGTLADTVTDFVCNRCLQQWYMLSKSDEAGIMVAKVQSSMAQLRDLLTIRKKPH